MITEDQLKALLESGHETRAVEYKGAGLPSDTPLMQKVIAAVMAVSNLRDGGQVVVGVDDKDPLGPKSGLTEEQVEKWLEHDNLADQFNKYADPPITFMCQEMTIPDDRKVVVIDVEEFGEVPTLCKKDFSGSSDGNLQLGRLYVRSKGKPASIHRHTHHELRELLELAGEKALRRFLLTANRAHIDLAVDDKSSTQFQVVELEFEDLNGFREILADGYFRLSIHPSSYIEERLNAVDLHSILRKNQVHTRGWGVPQVDDPIIRRQYAISSRFHGYGTHEVWQFHTSGAFSLVSSFESRWKDADPGQPVTADRKGLPIWAVLYGFQEYFILASRLALNCYDGEPTIVRIECGGLEKRHLVMGDPMLGNLREEFAYGDTSWVSAREASATELISNPDRLAVEAAQSMFGAFGLRISESALFDMLGKISGS